MPATDTAASKVPAESVAAELLNHRYQAVRPLGRGGMGSVFLALDLQMGGRAVALKRVRKDKLDRSTLSTLRSEFLALAALRHPNLTCAYDFGTDYVSGDLFFTSELVNGITWMKSTQKLNLATPEGFATFVRLTAQVLRGLEFIHSCGLVHSDIKPENILVTSESPGDCPPGESLAVKIIDFGLVKKGGISGGKKILGTPYYVAPETILGAQIDGRTDLYSLGVVLYHLATGSPPFKASSNIEILKSHVEQAPTPPHEVTPSLPPAFGEIVLKLMAKKPQDRFQSAAEVIEHAKTALGLDLPLETLDTSFSYLERARLSGREEHSEQLRELFQAVAGPRASVRSSEEEEKDKDGDQEEDREEKAATLVKVPPGRLVVIRGEKGLQKRRLLEDFRAAAQAQGARFFSLECTARANAGEGFEHLVGELGAVDELRGKVGAVVFVEKALGFVQRLQDLKDEPLTGYELVLEETVRAILRASQDAPVILCIQDLHLAARPVLRLLESLMRASSEGSVARSKLLMTGTVIDRGELQESDFEKLCSTALYRDGVLELELRRLDEAGVADLVLAAFKGLAPPQGFVQRILEESDGNTEVVVDILKHFLQRGKLCRTSLGWALDKDYENEDLPGRVRRELKDRIGKLPAEALELGRAFACLGDSSDLEIAAQLAGIPGRSVLKMLELLRAERILQPGGAESRAGIYSFVHSSARAILYNSIPAETLPEYHEKAGNLSEARGTPQAKGLAGALAHHFVLAGNREKGIRYGLDAAKELAREFAPLQAIELYEKVLALAGSEDRGLKFRIEREIAALRFQIGDYQGALQLLQPTSLPPEIKRAEKVNVYIDAARAYARLGQFDHASNLLNRSIRPDKGNESTAELAAIMMALSELHFCKGNLVESLRCATRLLKSKCEIKDPWFLSQLHMMLAENHSLLNNMESAVSHCQMALRMIESQHDSRHLAWSLYLRGKYHLYKRQFQKALRQFQLCLLLRRKISEFDGQADCLRELGALHHMMGNQLEAKSHLESALELYTRTGNVPQAVAARCTLAEVSRLLGEYDSCHESIADALRLMDPLEKRRLTIHTLFTMAGVALDRGELTNAKRHLEEAERMGAPGRGANVSMLGLYPLQSELAMHNGELGAALDRLAEGILAAREVQDPVALARLTAQQAYLLCRVGRTGEARRTLISVFDTAKSHDLPALNGWAKLIEGMVLADEGKLDNAEKAFTEATEILTSHGSARDLAHLYLEHGLLCLRREQHEQAYLNFEEGIHLTDKLQLSYLRSRYFFAAAALEAVIPGGQASRAERNLLHAESVAAQTPYPEILWQVRYHLGKLFLANKRFHEAEVRFKHAIAGMNTILRKLPQAHVAAYRKASGAKDIDTMVEGCRFASLPMTSMLNQLK